MKSRAINSLAYTGTVTLSQYIGAKKVKIAQFHNTGGSSLFNFLADCLTDLRESTFRIIAAGRPAKVRLLQCYVREETDSIDFKPVSGFIYLDGQGKPINENPGQCHVRYSFLIPRDQLETVTDYTNLGLGLYSQGATENDTDSFMAFCYVNLSRSSLVSSSLVVDWDLIITNSGDVANRRSNR